MLGYPIQTFATLVFPNLDANIVFAFGWVELFLPLWLLIKGVNVERWEKRALARA